MPPTITLRSLAADGDSAPIALPRPFVVRPGAVLDLSAQMERLTLPPRSDVVNFEVKAKINRPGLPSADWTLTDNLHDNPQVAAIMGQDALDGDASTRWATGRSLQPGDGFTLDMAAPQQVTKLVLDSAKSPDDYPAGYRLEASVDGKTWTQVAHATQAETAAALQGGVLTISFPAHEGALPARHQRRRPQSLVVRLRNLRIRALDRTSTIPARRRRRRGSRRCRSRATSGA